MSKIGNYCGSGPLYWWIWPFVLDTTSVLVGKLPSGGYFSPKSPSWKWEIVYILDFNKKCQNLIIPVDLVLCTGYNLCASRQASLRGLFFTKKSVLKMRIRYFLNFNKKCQKMIIHVDLALCAGYNLWASRQHTLRGSFFAKKSVLKTRKMEYLDFSYEDINFW